MSEVCTLYIDNGTSMIKSGFAGDGAPRAVYPSIIGFPRSKSVTIGLKTLYIGDEAMFKRGILTLQNIFSKGKVVNFDNYEKLLHHNFYNELRVAPEEHPLIISETTGTEESKRQKTTEMFFENFSVPAFYIENDNAAALYTYGRATGTVLNIGQEHSSCTPIYQGQILSHSVTFGDVSGTHINEYLHHLMNLNMSNIDQRKVIYKDIKEKYNVSRDR